MQKPHVEEKKNSSESYFAVCPACNNPIQMIGLKTEKPYGRHYGKSIEGLAEYDRDDYKNCPYSNPKYVKSEKRTKKTGIPSQILEILKGNLDRVVYILQRSLDVYLSPKLVENMLRSYMVFEGYLHYRSSLINIPWMFAYMSMFQGLENRRINLRSELHDFINDLIAKNKIQVTIDEFGVIHSKNGKPVFLGFSFINHQSKHSEEDGLVESMDFVLGERNENDEPVALYKKEIKFNHGHFQNLINENSDLNRDEKILEIADRLIK